MCLTGKINGKRSRGWSRRKYMDGIVEVMGERWTATSLLCRMGDRKNWCSMVVNVLRDIIFR